MTHPRIVTITLSEAAQKRLMPLLASGAQRALGLAPDQVGGIVVEALGRLTAVSALSYLTVNKVLLEEIRAYAADPAAYEGRVRATDYAVLAFTAPPGSLDPSADVLAYVAPRQVPTGAAPRGEWWRFADELDGYELAQSIGWDAGELADEVFAGYRRTGSWRGSMLDLRIALFVRARALRRMGPGLEGAGAETIAETEALLRAIAGVDRAIAGVEQKPLRERGTG